MVSKKKRILALGISGIVITSVILIVVLISSPAGPPAGPRNVWTWMSGNNIRNQTGTNGVKGVADAANVPGARTNSVSWTDAAGNFWLFGGLGLDNASNVGRLNDLWKFDGASWTWVSGNYSVETPGTYGVKGDRK
ncbi:MAG: hypothetical protein HWN69_10225, partial [Desulfobacterales bacterium]|nr:hypothetical protein [Desulfobacterales bacterium]